MNLNQVMQYLYVREINSGVSSFWDDGFDVWIGHDVFKWQLYDLCVAASIALPILIIFYGSILHALAVEAVKSGIQKQKILWRKISDKLKQ